ncbi:hypothetical protein DPV78_006672 [Talaromyces pinophilus]|nr:hypothetical protein DPV78_006672 [Talaromyces pinophilus]
MASHPTGLTSFTVLKGTGTMPNVGRPSRDCYACRKRRIKCDLLRPECTQCQRKSQSCPGYRDELELIFRIESVSSFEAKKAGGNNDKRGGDVADEQHVDEHHIKSEK